MVTGANDPAVDPTAVQAAANAGGRVLLVGTFDFGPNGSVAVARDVRFEGQLGPKGEPLTIVRGGLRTFYLDAPASLALRSIRFTESFGVPILVRRGTGLEVDGVEIFNVRPDPRWWGDAGVLATAGVMVSPWDIGGVTGLVSIRNTAIRLNPDPSNSPVYDAERRYRGVIEVSERISKQRALQGEGTTGAARDDTRRADRDDLRRQPAVTRAHASHRCR